MKLAKYSSSDRCDLISNNEYGYCCLVTATQKVLDKLDVENQIHSVITPTGRIDTPLWDRLAIREAVINGILHNDYIYGSPSKVEIFSDHIEVTSIGRIPDGLAREDFFTGVSMPKNKELMRVFRDLEMVEALGSGMPRILRSYTRDNFEFGDSYTRFTAKFFEPRDNSAPKSAPKSSLKSGLKKSNNHLPKSLIIYELIKTTPEITILQ